MRYFRLYYKATQANNIYFYAKEDIYSLKKCSEENEQKKRNGFYTVFTAMLLQQYMDMAILNRFSN